MLAIAGFLRKGGGELALLETVWGFQFLRIKGDLFPSNVWEVSFCRAMHQRHHLRGSSRR